MLTEFVKNDKTFSVTSGALDAVSPSEALPNIYRFHDLAISELSAELRGRLQRCNGETWFSSLGFAESYCLPPAERVCFLEDSSGEVIEKCFYRERRWAAVAKHIEIMGPTDPRSHLLYQLRLRSRAHMMTVRWMTTRDFPTDEGFWKSPTFRRTGEDCCIQLPTSPSEYLQTLGSSTRKHLPYYVRRLDKEWGARWAFEGEKAAEISKESYERLFVLNHLRMDQKGRRTAWTKELRQRRWKLVQESGLLCCLRFQGDIVGGTLSFLHGNEAYLIVLAHDPEFDRLNLGNVSLWLTIQHLIRSGYTRYHLMWGRSFYKEQLGSSVQPLYEMTLFANSAAAAAWRFADSLMMLKAWNLATKLSKAILLYLPGQRSSPFQRADSSAASSVKHQPNEGGR